MRSSTLCFIGSLGMLLAACDGTPDETGSGTTTDTTTTTSDTGCDAAYPDAPAGAGELVYVAGQCPAEGADGTAHHPYKTLSAALAQSTSGATLLVSAGHYAENLVLDRPVTIVGSSTPEDPESAELTLDAPEEDAVVVTAADVRLIGLHLLAPKATGVHAAGGSVTISGSKIESVSKAADGKRGFGALGTEDGAIILQHSVIAGAASHGLLAQGARAIILQSEIRDSGGTGVRLEGAVDEVKLDTVKVLRSKGIGVAVLSSRAIILQSEIRDTALDDAGLGDGVLATDIADASGSLGLADLTVTDSTISGNARTGVLCNGQTRTIILQRNHVNDNGAPNLEHAVAGVWLQGGAGGEITNEISENEIAGNRFIGVHMMGETHGILVQSNVLSGTLLGTIFSGPDQISIGDGISLVDGASAMIRMNQIKLNGRFGVIVDAAGAGTEICDNAIVDNDQYGIILQNQAEIVVTNSNTFSGNGAGDMATVAAGTYGVAKELLAAE